ISFRMTDKPARRYNFGASKGTGLSAIANKMWDQGKQEFGGQLQTMKPVILERKGLSDVLDQMKKDQGQPAPIESSSSPAQPAFVFGQKLSERVLQPTHTTASSDAAKNTENTFKTAAAAEKRTTLGDNDGTNGGSTASTAERLRADAEQYSKDHEKHAVASTSVIDVKTGEEDDKTIHCFSCKIHSFEASKKQWVERGMSSLKINLIGAKDDDGWTSDAPAENYRIVARTFGTMKLVINSPVFADMLIEKMDERRIKITAVSPEGGAPQVFLITNNLAKTDSQGEIMYSALKETRERVKRAEEGQNRKRKRSEEVEENVPETKKAAEAPKEEKEVEEDPNESIEDTQDEEKESEDNSVEAKDE
ncbi:hypothetical protein PFISCL1PPCAC_4991, partial [Pristionchus fissidentatus]